MGVTLTQYKYFTVSPSSSIGDLYLDHFLYCRVRNSDFQFYRSFQFYWPVFRFCFDYRSDHVDVALFIVLPIVVIIYSDALVSSNLASKNPFQLAPMFFEYFFVFWHNLMP